MTTRKWASGVNGDWDDKTKWTGDAVPTSGEDATISASGAYIVTVNTAAVAKVLTLDAAHAGLAETAGGSLNIAGAVNLEAGVMYLSSTNTLGVVNESGGELRLFKGSALGSAKLVLTGGEVSGMATESIDNFLDMSGKGFTIDAASGATVDFGAGKWSLDDSLDPTVQFGSSSRTGIVLWHTPAGVSIGAAGSCSVDVAGGTLKAADDSFGFLFTHAASTTVAKGAAVDLNGFSITLDDLKGSGRFINSGSPSPATLILDGGAFSGVISGVTVVEIATKTMVFTGANTYSDLTSIDHGATLRLRGVGSITGEVDDDGTLDDQDSSHTVKLGPVNGSGRLVQSGAGTLDLTTAGAHSGGTTIEDGVVDSLADKALGVGGPLTMTGGELLASVSQTISHNLHTGGAVTIAAAHGTTLDLRAGDYTVDAGTVVFGDGADDGVVVFRADGTLTFTDPTHSSVEVRAGTLKQGDSTLSSVLEQIGGTRIDAGAAVDAAGHTLDIGSLTGSGVLKNSGAATVLTLFGATNFDGAISGAYSQVDLFGAASLGGNETFSGPAVLEGGTLTLSGLFGEAVEFNGGGTLVLTLPSHFTGKIEDLTSGSIIDLRNITAGSSASVSFSKGVLTVSDGTHTDHLAVVGAFKTADFTPVADGLGGTNVELLLAPPSPPRPSRPAHPFILAAAGFGAPVGGHLAVTAHAEGTLSPALFPPRA